MEGWLGDKRPEEYSTDRYKETRYLLEVIVGVVGGVVEVLLHWSNRPLLHGLRGGR